MIRRYTYKTALLYSALVVSALFFLAPLYVMLVASFKPLNEVRETSIIAFPRNWTIEPWLKAWSSACSSLDCIGIKPFFLATFEIAIPAMS